MSSVSIITNDDELKAVTESMPEGMNAIISPPAEGSDSEQLVGQLASLRSDLVVLGPDIPELLTVETAELLRKSSPEVACVAFRRHDHQFFASAIRSGLRDVVDPTSDGIDGLRKTLISLSDEASLRKSRLLASESTKERTGAITILGPKGGVGKTTVAINLAYGLAMRNPNQVVLVDLDLAAGEVSDLLQLEPTRTIASLANGGAYLDSTTLKLSLSSHSSGLLVLPAPATLVEAETVDPKAVSQILDMLSKLFRFVIVDTGPGSTDMVVSAVEAARELLVVASPEISGLRTLGMHLSALREADLSRAPIQVVLNRADEKSGVSTAIVEEALGAEVSHTVALDQKVAAAANQGAPYLELTSKGQAAMGLNSLVSAMSGDEVAEPTVSKKRFW